MEIGAIIFLILIGGALTLVGYWVGYYEGANAQFARTSQAIMKILYDNAKQDEKEGKAK